MANGINPAQQSRFFVFGFPDQPQHLGVANGGNLCGFSRKRMWLMAEESVANGGNGNFDGTTGTATTMIFTLSDLPAGTYFLRLAAGDLLKEAKFVVQRK